jgi:uncharacterized delta-60 repeat protein
VYGSAVARFTPSGTPDSSFGGTGAILEPSSNIVTISGPLLIEPGGKIVVAGVRIQNGNQVAVVERFNVDGTLDSTFASQASDGTLFSGPSSLVRGLAFDASGNNASADILVAGSEEVVGQSGQTNMIALARLTPNGALDPSFGSGGVQTTNITSLGRLTLVSGVAIDGSDNIVVGGDLAPSGVGENAFFAARYTSNGDLDPSFNHGAADVISASESPQTSFTGVVVERDGTVLVAGMTQTSGTDPEGPLAFTLFRLNVDGTFDSGFGSAGKALADFGHPDNDNDPHSVLLQPADGNIVLVGGSSNVFALARFIVGSGVTVPPPIHYPPQVGPISTPNSIVLPGGTVVVSAAFVYDTASGPCTAVWNWSDGSSSAGFVNESNGMGTVTGSHSYSADGFYPVSVTVTDSRGASGQSIAIPGVVVLLPIIGNISGSGRILSPRGAFSGSRLLSGKATFGLNAKSAGSGAASGKFTLKLKSAHLSFQSTTVNSLGENGGIVDLLGGGTINGAGTYSFLVSAATGGGSGKLRIQIWNASTGAVVYDSQPGALISAAPVTKISGGKIALHLAHSRAHRR